MEDVRVPQGLQPVLEQGLTLATMLAPCPGWAAFGVAAASGGTAARRYQLDTCLHLEGDSQSLSIKAAPNYYEKEEKH